MMKRLLTIICLVAVSGCSPTTASLDESGLPYSSFRPTSNPVVSANFGAKGEVSSVDRQGRFYSCKEGDGCNLKFKKGVELIEHRSVNGIEFILKRDDLIGPISFVVVNGSGKLIYEILSNEGEEIYGFDVYKDRKIAVARGEFMCADLRDYTDGKLIYELCIDQEYAGAAATSLKFSPQGDKLIVGHFRGRFYIWDLKQRKIIKRVDIPEDGTQIASRSVDEMLFSPDGKMLFVSTRSAVYKSSITLFSVEDGVVRAQSREIQGISRMEISPDGKSIAVIEAGWKKRVLLLDANSLKVRKVVAIVAKEKRDKYYFSCLNFSPDGKRLLVGDSAGEIRIYELG